MVGPPTSTYKHRVRTGRKALNPLGACRKLPTSGAAATTFTVLDLAGRGIPELPRLGPPLSARWDEADCETAERTIQSADARVAGTR